MATSVTRHGITWTFDTDYTVGTYANGDYYVVENTPAAGVTISSISPTPSAGRNGTVVNPTRGTTQGFDDRVSAYNTYDESLNVGNDLPLVVSASSSVVSSISTVADQSFEQIETFAVLTVLASAPAANSFRPAYIGGDYTHPWAKSDLNYNALANMDRTAITVPSITDSENSFDKVWYEQDLAWTGRYMHTDYMGGQNGYGKSMAIDTGTAALQLNLDYSDAAKETLLIRLVQYGIDIHGLIEDGGEWKADGGHNPGRFIPLFIAAMTLNDANMKANVNANNGLKFQEYQQTFYVSQDDINLPRYTADGRPRTPYTSEDLNKPEWGINHSWNPQKDGDNWDAYYRSIGGGVLQAPAIVVKLMNGTSVVNWPPLQDYAQRHIYYRQSRYADPVYYNGYDDGDAYGDGNTSNTTPFAYNETPAFHSDFYLEFEDADPVGSTDDLTAPVVSGETVATKTDTTATIEFTTDEGASSFIEWDTDSGTPYANSTTATGFQTSHSTQLTGLTASTTYYYRIYTEDSFGNGGYETESSFTTNAATTVTATPDFSPAAGNYWETQSVTITGSDTPDSIEYTTDGTDPDGDDTTYSTPVSVSDTNSSVRLKAVASKSGQSDSLVGISDYVFSPWNNAAGVWANIGYPAKTTAWTEDVFATIYETDATDAVIGFGLFADNYNDLAVMWRFSQDGLIEARNGASYTAENTVEWEYNKQYKFSVSNVVFGTSFDLSVSVNNQTPVVIATNYAWRSDWTGTTTINNIGVYDSLGGECIVYRSSSDVVVGQVDARKTGSNASAALFL